MAFEENLKKAFGKRMQSGQWPPFFAFDAEGVIFIGQITGEHISTYWDPDKPLRVVHAVEAQTGIEYSMPTVRGVIAAWDGLKVEAGDYVFLEYLGETKLKRGAGSVKSYNVSKLTEEEYNAVKKGEDPEIKPIVLAPKVPTTEDGEEKPEEIVHESAIVEDFMKEMEQEDADPLEVARKLGKKYKVSMKEMRGIAEQAMLEKGSQEVEERAADRKSTRKKTKKPAVDTAKAAETRQLLSDVLEFYDEIGKEQLMKSMKSSGIDTTIEEVLEVCKDMIVVKGDTITGKPE